MSDFVPLDSMRVRFCTNTFIDVPIILEYDGVPLLEVIRGVEGAMESVGRIFSEDGVDLARWKGKRLFLTPDGEKAGVKQRHLPDVTVIERGGAPIVELRKPSPLELHPTVELRAPDGYLLKGAPEAILSCLDAAGDPFRFHGITVTSSQCEGCRVGFRLSSDGDLTFGAN